MKHILVPKEVILTMVKEQINTKMLEAGQKEIIKDVQWTNEGIKLFLTKPQEPGQ